jgi:hypothetical protein
MSDLKKYGPQFYKYRGYVTLAAFCCTVLSAFIPEFFTVYGIILMYPLVSVLGDTFVYKILGKKESNLLSEEVLNSVFKITGKELDQYARRMSRVRLFALATAIGISAAFYYFGHGIAAFCYTYIGINMLAWIYARFSPNINQPIWYMERVAYTPPDPSTDAGDARCSYGTRSPASPIYYDQEAPYALRDWPR